MSVGVVRRCLSRVLTETIIIAIKWIFPLNCEDECMLFDSLFWILQAFEFELRRRLHPEISLCCRYFVLFVRYSAPNEW
jgi:hypothetical protein